MIRTQGLLLFAAGICGSSLTVLPRATPAPWLINETPSVPRGLYLRTRAAPAPGRLVVVAPPASAGGYLSDLGAGADARLLKRVAAGPDETVCRDGLRLSWPRGQVVALDRDRRGRPLPNWQGCRKLGPDELLLVGDSPTSFDSRYFGPVRRAAVEGVYREAWRW